MRFLTADQSIPLINKEALIKDWAQWSLVSLSVFHLLWLRRGTGPPGPEPAQVGTAEQAFRTSRRRMSSTRLPRRTGAKS